MINLLPPQKKEELRKEKNLKLVFILGFLFLSSLFCFVLLLLPIRVFFSGEVEAQKILYKQEENDFNNSQLQSLQKKILQANTKINQLDAFYKQQFQFMEVFDGISKIFPKEMSLTSLSVHPQAGKITVNLLGFSPTRSALLLLKENLEKEEKFSEIKFPPSNWLESENINFSASFEIK